MVKTMKPKIFVLFMVITANAMIAGAGNEQIRQASDFELKSMEGRTVKLSDFRGKAVVLNFWATWCASCRVETPWLIELSKKYKKEGLEVIGVSMDDGDQNQVANFVQEWKVDYTVLHGTPAVGDQYGGLKFLPQTFFIDRNGKIIKTASGMPSKKDLENEIRQLLQGKS